MTSSVHLLFASGELSFGFTTRGDGLVALFSLISPWISSNIHIMIFSKVLITLKWAILHTELRRPIVSLL